MPARRYRTTTTLGAALTVALAAGLTGCSGGSDPAPTTSTSGPAIGAASASGAPAASLSPVPTGERIAGAKVAGAIRQALGGQAAAKVVTKVEGGIGSSDAAARSGKGSFTGGQKSLRTQLDVIEGGQTITVIATPDTVYLQGLLGGSAWAKTAIGGAPGTPTLGGTFRAQTDLADPWRILPALQAATSVLSVAPTTLHGTQVSSYKVTLRPQDSFALLPREAQTPELKQAFTQLKSVQTVSLDQAGHPLRVVTRVSGRATVSGSTQKIDQTSTVTYSAWGSAVEITLPAKATDMDQNA